MLVIGPVSSVFDFLTFYVMLKVFHAGEALFQTGWFVESLATQVLVIFIIRTRGNPFKSRPNPVLSATSFTVAVLGAVLPFTPLGTYFGFVPPPAQFLSHPGGDGGCLPDCGRTHQEGLLPVAQRSSLDGRRWRRGALKLMVRRLANSARWHQGDRPA